MEDLLTVSEVAEALRLNEQTIRNWIDRGEPPALRLGRRVPIRQSDLEALIEASSVPAPTEEPLAEDVDEGSVIAWATFGAAMAEATATLERVDRAELVAVLDGLAEATGQLAETLRATSRTGR